MVLSLMSCGHGIRGRRWFEERPGDPLVAEQHWSAASALECPQNDMADSSWSAESWVVSFMCCWSPRVSSKLENQRWRRCLRPEVCCWSPCPGG